MTPDYIVSSIHLLIRMKYFISKITVNKVHVINIYKYFISTKFVFYKNSLLSPYFNQYGNQYEPDFAYHYSVFIDFPSKKELIIDENINMGNNCYDLYFSF